MRNDDYYRIPSRTSFIIGGREDMRWLREVHLPGLSPSARSAMIYGNEDSPDMIEVYNTENPDTGEYHEVYVRAKGY